MAALMAWTAMLGALETWIQSLLSTKPYIAHDWLMFCLEILHFFNQLDSGNNKMSFWKIRGQSSQSNNTDILKMDFA